MCALSTDFGRNTTSFRYYILVFLYIKYHGCKLTYVNTRLQQAFFKAKEIREYKAAALELITSNDLIQTYDLIQTSR